MWLPATPTCSTVSASLKTVLGKGPNGELVRKTGVMTIVLKGGVVAPGDAVVVELPVPPLIPLGVV
ncbi:hypothetical protein HF265_30285 [Rhizobium leguminosarum]|nr:hypothetical protein [Rhizobium leguminosarum]